MISRGGDGVVFKQLSGGPVVGRWFGTCLVELAGVIGGYFLISASPSPLQSDSIWPSLLECQVDESELVQETFGPDSLRMTEQCLLLTHAPKTGIKIPGRH
jgi:hypothetical protein